MIRLVVKGVAVVTALGVAIGCRGQSSRTDLERGGQAFLAQCAVCHGSYGQGDGPLAASIAAEGKAPPAALNAARAATLGREGIHQAIESGVHVGEGSPMPVWGPHLGPEWTDRITDYVVAMPGSGEAGRAAVARYLAAPSGTPREGRRVYVMYCSGCHGPQGEGDGFFSPSLESGLGIPPLRGSTISGIDEDGLLRFIGLGGAHAPNASTMPGWLYTLSPDDRRALAGYLRALPGAPTDEQER